MDMYDILADASDSPVFVSRDASPSSKKRGLEDGEITTDSQNYETFLIKIPHGARAHIDHDGHIDYIYHCSPQVYISVLFRQKLPPYKPRVHHRPSGIFNSIDSRQYMQMLQKEFANDMWNAIITAAQSGKLSQAYNVGEKCEGRGYDKFKAPRHLNLGVPWQVLELFLDEMKKVDNDCPLSEFGGKLYGIETTVMRNKTFTVVFDWSYGVTNRSKMLRIR